MRQWHSESWAWGDAGSSIQPENWSLVFGLYHCWAVDRHLSWLTLLAPVLFETTRLEYARRTQAMSSSKMIRLQPWWNLVSELTAGYGDNVSAEAPSLPTIGCQCVWFRCKVCWLEFWASLGTFRVNLGRFIVMFSLYRAHFCRWDMSLRDPPLIVFVQVPLDDKWQVCPTVFHSGQQMCWHYHDNISKSLLCISFASC